MKHFLSITDFNKNELMGVLALAKELKEKHKQAGESPKLLQGKTLAMIFEKPSLRTRISFEIAMQQLGGHAIYLGPQEIGLGTREPISDVAKVTSSMANGIMARTFAHTTVEELAKYSFVPVINGLSDLEHPCQILADLLTIYEQKGTFTDMKLAFIGDGENNVAHSLTLAAAMLDMHISVAAPKGFWMKKDVVEMAKKIATHTGSKIIQTENPQEAVTDADIVYTDTWISMGDEKEKENRLTIFKPYQVTADLLQYAKPNVIVMHDLPAYRGNEITNDVIEGPQSVVFEQAENRLHAQKALLVKMLTDHKN